MFCMIRYFLFTIVNQWLGRPLPSIHAAVKLTRTAGSSAAKRIEFEFVV